MSSATTSEPLIRVMALHALAYCERLFYLEEVEEIRLADAAVYAGRRLHEEVLAEEEELVSLVLESDALGLKGKVDCIRRRDGELIPYEHKRGRSAKGEGGPEPWPSDRLQVAAYALLVEEHIGKVIPEARIRYHANHATVRVPINDQTREEVRQAVSRARELRQSVLRPSITDNSRLCERCSLAPVCLPEEERVVRDDEWQPLRLFPKDRDRQTVHVLEQGARVTRSGQQLVIVGLDGSKQPFPINVVGEVVVHGYAQVTTQALHMCAHHEIGVHWLTNGGKYVGGTVAGTSQVQRKIRQYEALREPGIAFRLAKRLALARSTSQLRFLLRASQGTDRQASGVQAAVTDMRLALKGMVQAEGLDALRGFEGAAGRAYFAGLPGILRPDLDPRLQWSGRTRRPPEDILNALLSFGYSLLQRDVMQAIIAVGLEPSFGFYHQPRSAAHPLVLDLMEEFRVPLWDMPMIASVNRLQWNPDEDVRIAGKQVWLSDEGRKKAIEIYERRKEDQWKHPVIGYSLSYARLIELEARLLEKEWSGQPGLFGQLRLR